MVSSTFAMGVPSVRAHVQIAFELPLAWPSQEQRHALVVVDVRIAHGAAVEHHRMVQQVAVAIRRVLQLVQEIRQQADVIAVQLGELGDLARGSRRDASRDGTASSRRSRATRGR